MSPIARAVAPVLIASLACVGHASAALIAQQTFEGGVSDNWSISTGSGNVSTASGSGDTPANQRILSGTHSFQVNNGTGTLTLNSFAIASGYSGLIITIRLSSTSTTTGNGADTADSVKVYAAVNNASFGSTPDLQFTGNSNDRWGYTSTTTLTTAAGSPVTGTAGGNYSYLKITLPSTANYAALKLVAQNDDAKEIWNVDDITLTSNDNSIWDDNGATPALVTPAATSATPSGTGDTAG